MDEKPKNKTPTLAVGVLFFVEVLIGDESFLPQAKMVVEAVQNARQRFGTAKSRVTLRAHRVN